jgi:Alr-MurF fusion protein
MKGTTLFSWSSSKDKNAEVHIIHGEGSDGKTPVVILHGGDETECIIPFTDKASIENASSAIATALCLNLDLKEIAKRVAGLQSVAMRMEKKAAINDSVLIEDFYNSDPGSLGMALDHLKELEYAKKTLIISDFIQSGRDATSLAREIVTLSERAGVSRFLCIGKELGKSHDIFPPGSLFFERTDNFIDWFSQEYFDGEAILLKGARIFGFEHISRLLELKVHATRLEINLNRVLSNLNYYRSKLKKDTRIMAMIKAFAYGTGSKEIASWLNFNGIDFLAVACTDEGIELRNAGVTNRVMVMSPDPWSFRTMIEYDLEPELFSNSMIRSFISEADSYGLVNYPVHIKLDTGMHRLGLAEEDLPETVKMIIESDNIKLASVFSHLGSSDRPEHDDLTLLQAERFINMCEYVSAHTGSTFLRHLLNSSGIERFPDLQFDMVRLGIGLYFTGIENVAGDDPAVVFKTTIAQVKKVKAGEGIGYGFTDISDHDRMIAVVPVGYADGLSRRLGGGNFSMYTAGKKVPTAGRICMDMCMLDVTSVDVNPGDEVEIFGRYISLNDIAEANETIPHEILSGIPPRVKRVFLYE